MIKARHSIGGLLAVGLLIALALGLSLPARAGLLAEYSFDNPASRLADGVAAGGYQDGTNYGVSFVPSDPFPPTQGTTVADFNSPDRFTVPDSVHPAGSDLSFTALVKVNPSGFKTVVSSDGMLRFQWTDYSAWDPDGTITIGVKWESGSYTNYHGDDFPANEWVFLAMRVDAEADKKGHHIEAFSEPAGLTTPLSTTTHLSFTTPDADTHLVDLANMAGFHIGMNFSGIGGPDNFPGMMDRVRFYDHYLSDTEIDSLYLLYTIPEPSTLLLFPLGIGLLWLARRRRG